MKLSILFTLIATALCAQNFERVKPKEPTQFEGEQGTTYGPTSSAVKVTDGDQVIIPELNGVVLTDSRTHLSDEALSHALGGGETVNVQVPGSVYNFNVMLTNQFLGKPLTKQGLVDLKQEILLYYRRWGRPIVTVEIPQQKITEGVLQVIVVEGKLGKVTVEGNRYFKSSRLKDYIRLHEGEAIDSNVLVADLTWINRNPFRQVDVIYGPGEIAGTTDIRLLTVDSRPWRVYGGVDNTGYDETDTTRLFVGANWANVFGLDHIFSFQATTAPNVNRFWALTGQYTAPLPWRDFWVFYGGYSQVQGKMETQQSALRNSGYAAQASTRYNFILPHMPSYLHDIILGFDYKRTDNNLEFGGNEVYLHSVNLTQLALGYNGGFDNEALRFSLTVELFYSPGPWIGEQKKQDYSKVRYKAKSSYLYGRMTFAPIFRLPSNFAFALTLRGQASTQNLLPSEQSGLGGYNTVRGYKERQVNADNALLISTELRSPPLSLLKKKGYNGEMLQFLAFLDYGIGRDVRTEENVPKTEYLLSFGPGVRYELGPYINFRGDLGIQIKQLEVANNPKAPGFRFHFGLVASY